MMFIGGKQRGIDAVGVNEFLEFTKEIRYYITFLLVL